MNRMPSKYRRDSFIQQCVRCPQSYRQWRGRTPQVLCVDCRYVLNAWEKEEVWAA